MLASLLPAVRAFAANPLSERATTPVKADSLPETATLPIAVPAADAWRDEAGVTVVVALPGVAPADVQVTVEGRTLTVAGSQKTESGEARATVHRGWSPVTWKRSFELGDELDTTAIAAKAEHGLLRLTLPVAAHAAPRRITVAG